MAGRAGGVVHVSNGWAQDTTGCVRGQLAACARVCTHMGVACIEVCAAVRIAFLGNALISTRVRGSPIAVRGRVATDRDKRNPG